jgi:hypothetical protein
MRFPKDCTEECPHCRIHETSIYDVVIYCELLDEECEAEYKNEYSIRCPINKRRK